MQVSPNLTRTMITTLTTLSAPFMLALASDKTLKAEKEMIVNAFDDWNVLNSTWFEVADYLKVIECLSEDETFGQNKRAALLSSKVAYCLGDYDTALHFALNAVELFSLMPRPPSSDLGAQDTLVRNFYNLTIQRLFSLLFEFYNFTLNTKPISVCGQNHRAGFGHLQKAASRQPKRRQTPRGAHQSHL